MTRPQLSPTPRSTPHRHRGRARKDRAALDDVLDTGLVCHLAVVLDDAPVVLPTGYGRDGDTLYLHGSTGARSLRVAARSDVAVTVTHVDGIVYARAAMHFSMNYRSAVVHGRPQLVEDPGERLHALRVIVEHLAPGSWDYTRAPNQRELAATAVLALDLTEAAVKVRSGPPGDDVDDVVHGARWAGVLPLHQTWGDPEPAPDLAQPVQVPRHVAERMVTTRSR